MYIMTFCVIWKVFVANYEMILWVYVHVVRPHSYSMYCCDAVQSV